MSRKVLDKKSTKYQTSSSEYSSSSGDEEEEEGCEEVGEKVGEIVGEEEEGSGGEEEEGSGGEEEEGSDYPSLSEEEEDSDIGDATNGVEEEELDGLTANQLHCYKMGKREEILTQLMSFADPNTPELSTLQKRYNEYIDAVNLITRSTQVEGWPEGAQNLLKTLKQNERTEN